MRAIAASALLAGLAASSLSALVPGPSSVVTGHLLGHDSRPLAKAHVHLIRPQGKAALATVEVSPDGSFRLATKETGALLLQFTGAHHRQKDLPVIIQKPTRIGLDVRLKTYEYVEDFGGVKAIGDFNGFNFAKAREMERQSDGTYSLEVEARSQKVSYELVGIEKSGRAINGTQSDAFEYDGAGDYRSVIRAKGSKATIRFDPKRLVRSSAPAQTRFAEPDSLPARFASIYDEIQTHQTTFHIALRQHQEAGKRRESLRLDWSADETALWKRLGDERDPLLRQALALSLVNLSYCGGELASQSIGQALADVPPVSPLWSYYPHLIEVAVRQASEPKAPGARGPEPGAPMPSDYVEQVVNAQSDRAVGSLILYFALWQARTLRQNERANLYYQRLTSEFGDSSEAKSLRDLATDSKIRAGQKVPAFSLIALEDSNIRYTPETLKGKIYLMDFWATWCGPCLGELETLHKAYEKYKDRGLEILSLSFDSGPENVRKFRKGRWPMPWLHTFVTDGFESGTAKTFEVGYIPKLILVDRSGTIIATFEELSGAALDTTLDRALVQKE